MIGLVRTTRLQLRPLDSQVPAPTLNRGQRRHATRQVRGRAAPPHQSSQEVTATAQAMAAQLPMVMVFVGFATSMSGAALGAGSAWSLALTTIGALATTAGAVVVYRDTRLARRWLREHHPANATRP